jgi:L-malate glycosyltransferase
VTAGIRPSPARLRLLLVDHTAGVVPFQGKFAALAARPDIELTVFGPDRWMENYRMIRARSENRPNYRLTVGKLVWPGYENRGFFVSGLLGAVRRSRPDMIHLFEEPFSLIALQSLLARARYAPRTPVLFFSSDDLSYGYRYPYRPSWFYEQIERFSHRHCAGGTVVNDGVAAVLRSKGFQKPLALVPHGLDLGSYAVDRGSHAFRTEQRISPGELVVGYVGRLLPMKGVDLILRALALLRTRGGRVPVLVVVGNGPEEEALRRLAEELAVSAHVRFIPAVAHEEVPSLLRGMDVLVLPSRRTAGWQEQFGRVLIEGMAAGCVVIGSTCGAIPQVLGDAGILFPENDAAALADALGRVRDDERLFAELAARGMARVRAEYTWEAVASKLVAFYRRILTAAPDARAPSSEPPGPHPLPGRRRG